MWPVALIARESELSTLTGELDALRNGQGRAWVLLGERGTGKSALAEAFAVETRKASLNVLWMAGSAIGDGAECWPWPAIVREVGGSEALAERLSAGES